MAKMIATSYLLDSENLVCYRLGDWFVTEIKCPESGNTIARGLSQSRFESERTALEKASARARFQSIDFDLMVGG